MSDPLKVVFLLTFLLSTPVAWVAVYGYKADPATWAIVNSYGFAIGMTGLYLYPFFSPFGNYVDGYVTRLHEATINWIIWLTVFTQIVFQIPHNLMVETLDASRGSMMEWPFYAYGLADSRWSTYRHNGVDVGLAPEVWLINCNDAFLGVMVLCAMIYVKQQKQSISSTIILVLTVVFRDATLWRETVEYLWDHHRKGYPHTVQDEALRPHGIILLYLVNFLWLVAPLASCVWAYYQLLAVINHHIQKGGKNR
jgi:hypothetical protein